MSDDYILVVNPGSSSIKFGLYQTLNDTLALICKGAVEDIGTHSKFSVIYADSSEYSSTKSDSFVDEIASGQDCQIIQAWLLKESSSKTILSVAYRVVHGGDQYAEPVRINQSVIDYLTTLTPFAPLHQPASIETINYFMSALPKAQHWACFDTAFHRTMPAVSQTFALPEFIRRQGIKPYGFHGLSYQSILNQLKTQLHHHLPSRIIVAHLGSGASLCAIRDGKSIATTMTFSPLDGLPMATRCGRLDPGAVIYLIDALKLPPSEVLQLLNHESGLAGLSGMSGDIRDLMCSPNEKAQFAYEYFLQGVLRGLGEMVAILGGIDALVFTGGIGANNDQIRQDLSARLQWLGAQINPSANEAHAIKISNQASQIDLYAMQTDEELVMAESVVTHFTG